MPPSFVHVALSHLSPRGTVPARARDPLPATDLDRSPLAARRKEGAPGARARQASFAHLFPHAVYVSQVLVIEARTSVNTGSTIEKAVQKLQQSHLSLLDMMIHVRSVGVGVSRGSTNGRADSTVSAAGVPTQSPPFSGLQSGERAQLGAALPHARARHRQ